MVVDARMLKQERTLVEKAPEESVVKALLQNVSAVEFVESAPSEDGALVEQAPKESVVKAVLQGTNPVEFAEGTPSGDRARS